MEQRLNVAGCDRFLNHNTFPFAVIGKMAVCLRPTRRCYLVVMRGHLFRLIYLSAIAVTMFGWIWLMVDIFEMSFVTVKRVGV